MADRVRVCLDMTPAIVGTTGVARYAEELWAALSARDDVELKGFGAGRGRPVPGIRRVPLPLRVLHPTWRVFRRPRAEQLAGPADVVHSMDLIPPPTRAALVISLQDVLPASHPELFSDRARRTHQAKLAHLAGADALVVSTQAVAAEVEELVGVPHERMVVAPLAPAGLRYDAPPPIDGPYVLAVGSVTPRKGFEYLASAAAMLAPDCPPVLIAGPDGYRADQVRADVARLGRGTVRLLGGVDDATLGALLRHADVVVHPSLAEGFGLVCLEAMAAGAPLIAADIPAVREVVDDGAVLVPARDAEALAAALRRLLDDQDERAQLAERGLRRSSAFSWEAMAEGCMEAYRRASGEPVTSPR